MASPHRGRTESEKRIRRRCSAFRALALSLTADTEGYVYLNYWWIDFNLQTLGWGGGLAWRPEVHLQNPHLKTKTNKQKVSVVVCLYSHNTRKTEPENPWSCTQASHVYVGSSRPVRDPDCTNRVDSKTEMTT